MTPDQSAWEDGFSNGLLTGRIGLAREVLPMITRDPHSLSHEQLIIVLDTIRDYLTTVTVEF